ncbi:MAG TPA: alkaline phosphatase family protein [Candidatus Dormibacteraeota bacterium]|nr:alkaline phosphatase family protein [Candidatus Dormibacteraeota bacterium]
MKTMRPRVIAAVVLLVPALAASPVLPARAAADQTQISHVVVLMQENRSNDSYFGQLHFEGQRQSQPEPRGASNPDPTNPDAPPIKVFHQTHYCSVSDLNHSWTGVHNEIDGGAMDGFTAANVDPKDPNGSRAMGYYDQGDLPYYYALYNTFATSDRYFASVPGPTFPNREYLLAGTSFGHIRNDLPPAGLPGPSIFNLLDQAGITWKDYFVDVPSSFLFTYPRVHAAGHIVPVSQYFADAAAGKLPQVAFVDPRFGGSTNVESDEHPDANVQVGEKFVSSVIQALFNSPDWSSSAFFQTYDEHGGFYDSVAPPAAVVPDDIAPRLGPGDVQAGFDMYGVRVPAVVVSPFSRPHSVSHAVNDHTSILRFIETRFNLPALTRRDAAANPMLEFFDFSHPSFATPPSLPAARLNLNEVAFCNTVT